MIIGERLMTDGIEVSRSVFSSSPFSHKPLNSTICFGIEYRIFCCAFCQGIFKRERAAWQQEDA